jgi:transcriptional regulator GlxA family with amidase domain
MDARVKKAIEVIRQSVTGDLSVRQLSGVVNLSPSRLRQLFKVETGLSPFQYLRRVRLQRAASLLSTSFLSIKEAIFQRGGRDVSNFVRDFKKEFGLSPSAKGASGAPEPYPREDQRLLLFIARKMAHRLPGRFAVAGNDTAT